MAHELLKKLVGKVCTLSTGSLGESFSKWKITAVEDRWVQIEKKGKTQLLNADFLTNVKVED